MLPDEIFKELLIDAGLVNCLSCRCERFLMAEEAVKVQTHSSVPKGAAQFNGLEENRLGFLEGQVTTQAEAEAQCQQRGVS